MRRCLTACRATAPAPTGTGLAGTWAEPPAAAGASGHNSPQGFKHIHASGAVEIAPGCPRRSPAGTLSGRAVPRRIEYECAVIRPAAQANRSQLHH